MDQLAPKLRVLLLDNFDLQIYHGLYRLSKPLPTLLPGTLSDCLLKIVPRGIF